MNRLLRLVAVLGCLCAGGVGLAVTHSPASVRAAAVTTDFCSADVTPSTGVTVSKATNGDCVVSFASDTTVTWTRPTDITTFQVLVVAGGGGGGGHPSGDPGGGGGGGVVHVPTVTLNGATYEVKAGLGGIGNDRGPCGNAWFSGRDGGNSVFGPTIGTPLITANGGAGGGGACDTGRSGGSGGGGHCGGGPMAATQGLVDVSITNATLYGTSGGQSAGCGAGAGGGGGATTPGQDGTLTKAGDGGEGVALDVLGTGTPVVYASGGGGSGAYLTIPAGVGGTNAGNGKQGDGLTTAENNGVNGTGSGGGAQMCPTNGAQCPAGRGGDGIVIIRYAPTPVVPSNLTVPVISGTASIGSTLTTTNGTWAGTFSTYGYQWQRGSSAGGTFMAITGATSSNYVVAAADASSFIRVVVTATNGAGSATATAVATGPVPAPVTTTTTPPTTTTTTIAPVETTVAPAPVVVNNTPPSQRVSRTTTAPAVMSTASTALASTTTLSVTTTLPPVVAPTPPALEPGQATVVIDGQETAMSVTRSEDQLVLSQGDFTSTISSVSADGTRRPLDSDGNIRLEKGDALSIEAAGFAGESDIEVWMFSKPTRLGVIGTDANGSAQSLVNVVNDPAPGDHRIVLKGTTRSGSEAVMAVGVIVGSSVGGVTTTSKVLIILPIIAAIFAALVIPTRRRRRAEV